MIINVADVFAKFVDKDNKLKEKPSSDVDGLLSLYEAAHVRIHGENILEEAVAFTTRHLNRMLPKLESPLKEKEVRQALQFPLHKSVSIISLRFHIDIYENDNSRDELVLRLAKLNFNFMHNIFRNDLFQLTTWWNEVNMTSKVPYFRDRLIECYMWSMSHHFEPHYSLVRMMMTKFYIMVTIMDDTYDNYATLEETELFTQAIERWNVDEIDLLPDYLKSVYKFIMSVAEELEREAEKQGKSYAVPYFIEEMDQVRQLARGYGREQNWIVTKQMPSFEELMMNTRFTTLNYVVFIAIVALIKSGTKETIDWVLSDPEILIASSDIVRLNDDLFTHQRECKGGTLQTSMDCYMIDKGVSSMQEAESAFKELLEDRWKDLSASWVNCKTMVSKDIAVQFMDLARMCATIYKNDQDNYTYPEKNNMTPIVTALFLDSILI